MVKNISCVYENRSSVPVFRQTLNVRAHLASLTSGFLHYLTVCIPGVRMIHIRNEGFISKNLVHYIDFRFTPLQRKTLKLFLLISHTLLLISVGFASGTTNNPDDIRLLSPCC